MAERAQVNVKKTEAKRENGHSQTQKMGHSQSIRSPVEQILFLQRTIGNQAVGKLIKSGALQAKLRIGQPGDIYEKEADRVAEQVMRIPESQPASQMANETKVSNPARSNNIQRKCPECNKETKIKKEEEGEKLQKKEASASTPEVAPELESSISAVREGGQPLPESVRAFYEPRFGHDFSQVRVHTDAKAAETAREVNARAYTIERDIVFGEGQYAPGTDAGNNLMAHELTHVVQQKGAYGNSDANIQNRIGVQRLQGSFLGDIWKGIKSAAGSVWEGAKAVGGAVWSGIKTAGEWTWGAVKAVGRWGWDVLKSAGAWVWDLITEAPTRIWRLLEHVGSGIVGIVSWLWDGIKGALGHIWNAVKGVFRWISEGIVGLFSWIWEGLKAGGKWAWRLLQGDFSGFWEGIGGFFSWLGDGVVRLAKWGWEGLEAAAIWAWQGVKGIGRWLWNGFLSGAAWVGRLVAKLLDLVGFGEIMDLLWQIIKFNTRTLTSTEIGEAKKVFGNSISYWQVRIDEHSLISWIGSLFKGGGGMGVTTFHTINFNRKISTSPGSSDMEWLIHELTHVSQMEHVGMQYMGEAIHAQATSGYGYTLGKPHFRDYNREQQGDIARDYYHALSSGSSTSAYDHYIAELRAGDL